MASSYTYPITEGDGITFSEFAQRCARSMGACISLREEPLSNELPDELPKDNYHKEQLDYWQRKYDDFLAHPPTYEDAEREYNSYVERALRESEEANKLRASNRAKLEAMLQQVEAWQPPSVEHVGLKRFMIEQIKSDLEWEQETELFLSDKDKYIEDIVSGSYLKYFLDFHKERYEQYEKAYAKRNEWIRLLKDSLK